MQVADMFGASEPSEAQIETLRRRAILGLYGALASKSSPGLPLPPSFVRAQLSLLARASGDAKQHVGEATKEEIPLVASEKKEASSLALLAGPLGASSSATPALMSTETTCAGNGVVIASPGASTVKPAVSADLVNQLVLLTGCSVVQVASVLEAAGGDLDFAAEMLFERLDQG
jgi:hypothetical protein